MQATLGELLAAEPALARLAGERLPVKAAFHVARLIRCVQLELESFHAARNAVIKELGAPRDARPDERAQGAEAQVVSVLPENVAEFQRRAQELVGITVSLAVRPVSLSMLGGISVAAADLLLLGPMLVVDDEDDRTSRS